MRFAKWLLFIGVLLGAMTVFAQDTITLTPYTDEVYGIQGVLPDGWTKVGPGLYARAQSAKDTTVLAEQSAIAPLDTVVKSLLPQLQLKALPESTGTVETDALTWTVYKTDVTASNITVTVDLALAEKAFTAQMLGYSKDGTKPRAAVEKEIEIYRETLKVTKAFTPDDLEDMSLLRKVQGR